MAFLSIEGQDLALAEAVEMTPQEIGDFKRAQDGSALIHTTAIKRRWRCQTVAVAQSTWCALVGLLQRRGDRWTFDNTYTSQKGLTLASQGRMLSTTAADGLAKREIGDNATVKPGMVATGSSYTEALWVEPGVTNIFSSATANCDTDTGWSVESFVDGIVIETTNKFEGTGCLDLQESGSNPGIGNYPEIVSSAVSVSSGTLYVFSCWILATDDTTTFTLRIQETSGGSSFTSATSTAFAGQSGRWVRHSVVHTTGGSVTQVRCYVRNEEGHDWFQDACQLEARPDGEATSWVDGTRSADSGLDLSAVGIETWQGATIACWTYGRESLANRAYIANLQQSTSVNRVAFYFEAGSDQLELVSRDSAGSSTTITASNQVDGQWHHYAATYSPNERIWRLYTDGVLVATGAAGGADLDFSAMTDLIACRNSTTSGSELRAPINDLRLLPYGASAAQVAAMADTSAGYDSSMLQSRLTGDFICGEYADVVVRNVVVRHRRIQASGGPYASVSFVAEEV